MYFSFWPHFYEVALTVRCSVLNRCFVGVFVIVAGFMRPVKIIQTTLSTNVLSFYYEIVSSLYVCIKVQHIDTFDINKVNTVTMQ